MNTKVLFSFYRGDDYAYKGEIIDSLTNLPKDITGWEFKTTLKKNLNDLDEDAVIQVTAQELTGTDSENGLFYILLPNDMTSNLDIGQYYFDIQRKVDNNYFTLVQGMVDVKGDVTQRSESDTIKFEEYPYIQVHINELGVVDIGTPGVKGEDGQDGLTVYQSAIANGLAEGMTEVQYLQSLRGADGSDGDSAENYGDVHIYATLAAMNADSKFIKKTTGVVDSGDFYQEVNGTYTQLSESPFLWSKTAVTALTLAEVSSIVPEGVRVYRTIEPSQAFNAVFEDLTEYSDDTAAAAGGVAINAPYHASGVVRVRVS